MTFIIKNMVKTKNNSKLSVLLLLLAVVCSSCHSYDRNYTIYELWVNGVKVTTRNQADILGDGTVRFEGDTQQGVLTLEGACIEKLPNLITDALIVSGINHLTLRLVGENRIGMGERVPVNGIETARLTIEGEGSLQVGARAACIKAQELEVSSGTIETFVKTPDDEVASYMGIGLWAQDGLTIGGGDITVRYASAFSPLSYGLYCVKDVHILGGNIRIDAEDSRFLSVGLISSELLTIAGGHVSVYGIDDAINARNFRMTGGVVEARSVDVSADAVCRMYYSAEFTGGEMTMVHMYPQPASGSLLFSKDLKVQGMKVSGGKDSRSLTEKDISNYGYTDACIRICQ